MTTAVTTTGLTYNRLTINELLEGLAKLENFADVHEENIKFIFPNANFQGLEHVDMEISDLYIDDFVFTVYGISDEIGYPTHILKVNDNIGISKSIVIWLKDGGYDTELEGKIVKSGEGYGYQIVTVIE